MTSAIYLYGIVPATGDLPAPVSEGVAGAPVRVEVVGALGVVVSDLSESSFRARRKDLMAHSEVLQEVVAHSDVLPMRFGTLFVSTDEMAEAFLRPNQDSLLQMLQQMRGVVEVQVKGDYDPDAVGRALVAGDQSIRKLQERARNRRDIESNVAVGRRFADLLDQRRYSDSRRIVETLAPLARNATLSDPAGEYAVLNASFLVTRQDLSRFDAAVEELGRDLEAAVKLRCLGPLPPYSFIDAAALAVG